MGLVCLRIRTSWVVVSAPIQAFSACVLAAFTGIRDEMKAYRHQSGQSDRRQQQG